MNNGPALWTEILKHFPAGAIVAGGAVRDYLLGLEPKDIDVFITAEQANPPYPEPPLEGDELMEFILTRCFDPRMGLGRIDNIYERQEEYKALNNIDLVSSGQLLGYKVDAIVLSDSPTPEEIVADFDFGINQCWFDTEIHDTAAATMDRQTRLIRLYHFDRTERSIARFHRLNERHGGIFSLAPC